MASAEPQPSVSRRCYGSRWGTSLEAFKLRLFPSTLTGAVFSWYVKLSQNTVPNWQVMEQVFHEQFYRLEPEVSMANLAKISQKPSELVQEYLGRFRDARARCTVYMPEHEFAKLAQGRLLLDLRKKFEGIEFRDIYALLLQADGYEALLKEEQQKGRTTLVHAVDIEDIDSEERGDKVYLEEDEESAGLNLAEIVAKGPYVCKALSKASKDQRPTTAQMSKFSGTSQKADLIDRKILKFPEKATMGVDQNPFPNAQVNMVKVNFPRSDQPSPRLDLGGLAKGCGRKKGNGDSCRP
ncbi:hypothetical protein L3X38_024934 [Prunus dulcis]|uniref:Retrotransposon gag domain-containing protein n=1 Tax=Prunus dulcis TaxID=3755 RepID=A0AAD4W385_PRUDU|nr:hypothetical protein L3X38_024934 [Prunus dulcis]